MSIIGKLSQDVKDHLQRNAGELSRIEGNILSRVGGKEIKTFYITSCGVSEGKTTVAISMAYALSTKANLKVLLVEGNLHRPKIHTLFHVNNVNGLAGLFLSNTDYKGVLIKTEYENLTIIPQTSKVFNTLELFRTDKFKDKLHALRKEFDYIIFDGHSIFSSSDATFVARYFDGVIFVVECEKTKWGIVREAKEKVEIAGGNVLGIVLNKRKYYIPKILYGKI